MKVTKLLLAAALLPLLCSCNNTTLLVRNVKYQSVRTSFAQPEAIPESAKLRVDYFLTPTGIIMPVLYNLTDEIMVIDQTKSFFVNTDGASTSYYDPTVRTETSTQFGSTTTGASVNLGAVAKAFGVGGAVGTIARGINVGGAQTGGYSNTTTIMIADQQKVNIGPHGSVVMSKQFEVNGLGFSKNQMWDGNYIDIEQKKSPMRFSVCVTFSADNGKTYDKLVTDFYVSSNIVAPVSNNKVSNAFADIYTAKPDALAENVFMFLINNNIGNVGNPMSAAIDGVSGDGKKSKSVPVNTNFNTYFQGVLCDWK